MKNFKEDFMQVLDLSILGLYQKKHVNTPLGGKGSILKKALDTCAFLNYKYSLYKDDGTHIMPIHETELITLFETPLSILVDSLPNLYKNELYSTPIAYVDSLIAIGSNCSYYLLPDAYELLERRELFKAKDKFNPESEYRGQKFYLEMISKNQHSYQLIRDFLIQRDNVYIYINRISQTNEQLTFCRYFETIVDAAYDKLPLTTKSIQICPICGLVLRQNLNGELHCVTEYCRQRSKNFINAETIEINEPIMVLNEVIAHNIYYPGQLESDIKNLLEIKDIEYDLWPNQDEWDFELIFKDGDRWVVDAKVVENPYWIQLDIWKKENSLLDTQKIYYVVPNRRTKAYLNCIRKNITHKSQIQCLTFNEFKDALNVKLGGVL